MCFALSVSLFAYLSQFLSDILFLSCSLLRTLFSLFFIYVSSLFCLCLTLPLFFFLPLTLPRSFFSHSLSLLLSFQNPFYLPFVLELVVKVLSVVKERILWYAKYICLSFPSLGSEWILVLTRRKPINEATDIPVVLPHCTMGQNQVILRHQKFTFPRARE